MAKKVAEKKEVEAKVVSKEVAVKEDAQLITASNNRTEMAKHLKLDNKLFGGVEKSIQGEDKELFSNDILIPKVWLVQQMSDDFKEGKAKLGDYISSISKEVLAPATKDLGFIVLSMFKRWHTFEIVKGGKKEFMSSVVMTKENKNWKYQDVMDGKEIVRKQVISAYIVLVEDVKKGFNVPYVIDFASSSKGAGRSLVTDIATIENADAPSWVGWFHLNAHEESNDDGDFLVKDVKFQGYLDTQNEKLMTFMRSCYDYIIVHKDQITIDDSDVEKSQSLPELDQKAAMAKADRAASAKI